MHFAHFAGTLGVRMHQRKVGVEYNYRSWTGGHRGHSCLNGIPCLYTITISIHHVPNLLQTEHVCAWEGSSSYPGEGCSCGGGGGGAVRCYCCLQSKFKLVPKKRHWSVRWNLEDLYNGPWDLLSEHPSSHIVPGRFLTSLDIGLSCPSCRSPLVGELWPDMAATGRPADPARNTWPLQAPSPRCLRVWVTLNESGTPELLRFPLLPVFTNKTRDIQ